MDTKLKEQKLSNKLLQKEFENWCSKKNKSPKTKEEVTQLFYNFMKEEHPEEYKAAMENQLKQAQKALHGAKLNYLKSLKNQCAEDEEVVYYKKGGSVNCGCKKKEEGGEVRKAGLGCSTAVEKFKKMKSGKKITIKQQPQVNPSDTVHVNGIAYSVTNSDGSPVDNRFKPYSGKVEEEDRKKAKKGDKDALKRQLKQELASSEKCGGKVKKHQEGSVIAKFKAYRKGGSLNEIPFMQTGTPKGGIKRGINGEYYTMPVPYGASNRTGTNPFMDILTTNISNNPYLITGAPDFLPGMAGGNIGKVVGQIRKLPIGKRGAIRTINGKKVNILDKKVGWAKEADLRKGMDLDYNSKLAGRIDYSE